MAAGNIGRSDYVTGIKQAPIAAGGEVVSCSLTIALPAGRTPNDVMSLLRLPADHVPVDFIVGITDIDTGTSNTFSFGLMNAAETDISTTTADGGAAWLASSTAGQTAVMARPTTLPMMTVTPTQSDRIFGIKNVLVGSATAGTLYVTLFYRRAKYGA